MGSQAYGIGAGLQSLGSSMMQAVTMYSLLNEEPKELEDQLTEKEKIAKKAAQSRLDSSTINTDASIESSYDGLNDYFGFEDMDEPAMVPSADVPAMRNFGKELYEDPYLTLVKGAN